MKPIEKLTFPAVSTLPTCLSQMSCSTEKPSRMAWPEKQESLGAGIDAWDNGLEKNTTVDQHVQITLILRNEEAELGFGRANTGK